MIRATIRVPALGERRGVIIFRAGSDHRADVVCHVRRRLPGRALDGRPDFCAEVDLVLLRPLVAFERQDFNSNQPCRLDPGVSCADWTGQMNVTGPWPVPAQHPVIRRKRASANVAAVFLPRGAPWGYPGRRIRSRGGAAGLDFPRGTRGQVGLRCSRSAAALRCRRVLGQRGFGGAKQARAHACNCVRDPLHLRALQDTLTLTDTQVTTSAHQTDGCLGGGGMYCG